MPVEAIQAILITHGFEVPEGRYYQKKNFDNAKKMNEKKDRVIKKA